MEKKYLIIGAAAAGVATALALRRLDTTSSITLISDEPEIPYNKCLLADYAHGQKTDAEIAILNHESAQAKNITLCLGIKVLTLDRNKKSVMCSDGQERTYDVLFIGTGASPFIPPIQGLKNHPHVFTFYRLSDVTRIVATVRNKQLDRAVVIGAGLSGLECADALRARGLEVTVIEQSEHVLGRQVDTIGAQRIEDRLRSTGIRLYTASLIDHIDSQAVYLNDGTVIAADLIVCATGVRPNIELAQNAGLVIAQGGIVVNDFMQTSDPFIFACGDCALIKNKLSGELMLNCSWPEAMQQGMIAAHGMTGQPKQYSGACVVTSSSFFGVKFATCGKINDLSIHYEVHGLDVQSCYLKITVLNDRVCGYVLIGDIRQASLLRRLILTGESFQKHRTVILNPLPYVC